MNGERPPGDGERDAWLRAALRHAPDASAGAPPALAAAILREAQAKAAGAAARSARPTWWSAAWTRLARPSVGAAFAGIVVATTVVLLWRDEPLPEAARPGARVAEAPAAKNVAPASPSLPGPPAVAPVASPPPAAPPPAATRAEAPARAAQAPARLAKRREAAARESERQAPQQAREAAVAAAPANAADAAPKSDAAAAAPAPAAMVQSDALAAAPAAAPLQRGRLAVAAPLVSLGDVRAAVAAEPAVWTWRRGSGPAQPMGDALGAWLAALDDATKGRWRRAAGAGVLADSSPDALLLLRDGRVVHRLLLQDDGVRWDSAGTGGTASRWQAPLVHEDIHSLQSGLDEATR